jgi:hypothetical protein
MRCLPSPPLAILGALCALPLLAPTSGAQAFPKEKHPELGLEIQRPRKYGQVPVQPTEEWILLRYVEEQDARNPKARLPELAIVRIDWQPDPEPEPEPPAPDPPDEESERSRAPVVIKGSPPPPPITTLERYVERKLGGFELGPEVAVSRPKTQGAYVLHEYELAPQKNEKRRGYAFAWKSDARTLALFGACAEEELDDARKTWRYVAEKLVIGEPVESKETQKWRRYYGKRPEFSAPEFRLKIRSAASALKDWDVDDSDNYILVYNTPDQALIRSLKQRLEAIRRAYLELFPPAGPIDAVSAVRICRDAADYKAYGGPSGSGGYWNARAEELVFFDYADKDGERGSGKEDSLIVLYHEAFHQYIYYSVGEVAPHSWFNEGYGDYFSGAVLNSYGEVAKIGVNPWRINTIQRAITESAFVPWEEIIRFEQPQYYNPGIRHICYAQGWSMIYFLNQSADVQRDPRWSQILRIYFDTLKEAHAQETEQLRKAGLTGDDSQRMEAAMRTRKKAVEAAFEGVDVKALERAWIAFTKDLKPPK